MAEDQEYIYYASGESIERIDKLPQVSFVKDKGYDVLYFTDYIDEFAIKMLHSYDDKEFQSVSSSDLDLGEDDKAKDEDSLELFKVMKDYLKDKVKDVRDPKLKEHAVYLASEGELSIEMEKVLNQMPEVEISRRIRSWKSILTTRSLKT